MLPQTIFALLATATLGLAAPGGGSNDWDKNKGNQYKTECKTNYYTKPVTKHEDKTYYKTETKTYYKTDVQTYTKQVPYTTNYVETKTQCYTKGWGDNNGYKDNKHGW